jgi:hypothetical protein
MRLTMMRLAMMRVALLHRNPRNHYGRR